MDGLEQEIGAHPKAAEASPAKRRNGHGIKQEMKRDPEQKRESPDVDGAPAPLAPPVPQEPAGEDKWPERRRYLRASRPRWRKREGRLPD